MISPNPSATNEDWFDKFCSKVAPDYIPIYNEVEFMQRANTRADKENHILTKHLLLIKLQNAINSRKSLASGLDFISSILIKNCRRELSTVY